MLVPAAAFAQEGKKAEKKQQVEEHLQNHYKLYGFVRNYFAFDTRESVAGTEDLFYYLPEDVDYNAEGDDLNAIPSFRFAALTTRLGLDVYGYQVKGYKFGAKVEADFYCGVSGVTGTATLRLRQAYLTVDKNRRSWKVGQAWHPMAADMPDVFSLEVGVPFDPFSRTPQVTFDLGLGKGFSLTASALWQMQYTSTGPNGASANYIKYGCTPEAYLAFNFKNENLLFRLGADVLSIKPRNYGTVTRDSGEEVEVKVDDRLTTLNLYFYGQEKFGNLTWKQKILFLNDGSHMNTVGGYGVSAINDDGSWEYSATRSLSCWTSLAYKIKSWTPSVFFGYIKEFGTADEIVGDFWAKNNAGSLNQMFRIQPEVVYTIGKFQVGLEYMFTDVQYGTSNARKQVVEDLRWVCNHRVQAMLKYNF